MQSPISARWRQCGGEGSPSQCQAARVNRVPASTPARFPRERQEHGPACKNPGRQADPVSCATCMLAQQTRLGGTPCSLIRTGSDAGRRLRPDWLPVLLATVLVFGAARPVLAQGDPPTAAPDVQMLASPEWAVALGPTARIRVTGLARAAGPARSRCSLPGCVDSGLAPGASMHPLGSRVRRPRRRPSH